MGEIHFEIEGDYIVKYTAIPSMPDTYQKEIVMDKKTFLEAFEKWIPKVR
jgi:hypothetical protein